MSLPPRNPRGSTWRIWDLHVHTPASYGGRFEDFIENAKTSEASVIGLNDYGTVAGYKQITALGGIPTKVIFPVVELRMHNVLTTKHQPNGVKYNFHIIFDNDVSLFPQIETFLASLSCLDTDGNRQLLGAVADPREVSFEFREVIDKLKELKLLITHALIWLPYDEYGGIDEIDPKSNPQFKASLIKDAHFLGSSTAKQIAFFKWDDPKHSEDQYREWLSIRKPCIKGSDAHSLDYPFGRLMNAKSEPIEKYCWIKANPTFNGLKQIVFEPDRVFIGKEPDLLHRVRENKTKFLKQLTIAPEAATASSDIWFNNVTLDINSSLVAIIGNKGSGKSALTDVIALCGNTHQAPEYFSFLHRDKFRKNYPENLSAKFRGTIIWEDDASQSKLLSDNPDKLNPERVRYIPQHFFEKVCSSIDSSEFENELKNIVFSHTPLEKRLDKVSLDQLINHKSSLVDSQIEKIKDDISELNRQITDLEFKGEPAYITKLSGRIKLINEELGTHETIKPTPPSVPTPSDEANKAVQDELKHKREKIAFLELAIKKDSDERIALHISSDDLDRALRFYEDLSDRLDRICNPEHEHVITLKNHGINISDVLSFQINLDPIKEAKLKIDARIAELNARLDETGTASQPLILNQLNSELATTLEDLDKPNRIRQQYESDLTEWERKRQQIIGDDRDENSLPFLTQELKFVNDSLPAELEKKRAIRVKKLKALLAKKFELRAIRQELFDPVSEIVKKFPELESNYDVHLNVSLKIKDFPERFFGFITQNKIGTFQGTEDGNRRLLDLVDGATVETETGAVEFVEKIIDTLTHDCRDAARPTVQIAGLIKKAFHLSDFYDFLFQMDYVVPSYNLKLGEKNLTELSPGERGTLLLIFYLLLDKDDIPLVLDQPEDNLDNESIFRVLVKFIKRVKNQRQIIIVTHNPNLAIGCDAEQIVHCRIEKDNKNKVVLFSGAIEDYDINRASINILEGTLPAFVNRESKYIRPDELKTSTATTAGALST